MKIELELPHWVTEFTSSYQHGYLSDEERMRFTIKLAKMNIDMKTGGPFGAAVFNMATNQLVAAGVNVVESTKCSVAHAEVMAIMIAQRTLGRYNLSAPPSARLQLVTSTEPCFMCLGALIWSGIKFVACGARDEDARAIGFDEGPKPSDWVAALSSRGITVRQDVCRIESANVLQHYKRIGGLIYNG